MYQFIRLFLVRNEWLSGAETREKEKRIASESSAAYVMGSYLYRCAQPTDRCRCDDGYVSCLIDDKLRRIKCDH